MLKVIIADDEPKVALLIKSLIDWEKLGMELSGIAQNGSEALTLIGQCDPDVIVTDIRMPVIGGLELISEAKKIKPSLEFIIISGYKHFDYAHSAIKFGVSDYLLKPINQDELMSTLEKVKVRIESSMTVLDENERAKQIELDVERSKRLELFSIIYNKDRQSELTADNPNQNLGYHFEDGCCYRFLIFKIDGDCSEIYSEGLSVFTGKIREMYMKALSPLCCDIEIEFLDSKANIILGFPAENKQPLRDALKNVFDDVRINNNIFPSAIFTMIGGPISDDSTRLADSCSAAEWALQERLLIGAGSFYENITVRENSQEAVTLATTISKNLSQAMDVMDFDSVSHILSESSDSMLNLEGITGKDIIKFVRSVYDEWLILCQRYDPSFQDAEKQRVSFIKKLNVLASAKDVSDFLAKVIRESFKNILENLGQINGRPISHAKKYIKDHFSENITISDIAEQEGFNVSYFSTLFKKETGRTFSEYLMGVRIDEAKRFLKETNLSIVQICEAVGYSDTKHFTAIFRKSSGIKPSEYRKLYSWGR